MDDEVILKKTNMATPTGIGILGSLCAAQLLESGKVLLFVDPTDNSIRVEQPEYSIALSQIDEDLALNILVLMGKSDEELKSFLEYRWASAETSDVPSRESTPQSQE